MVYFVAQVKREPCIDRYNFEKNCNGILHDNPYLCTFIRRYADDSYDVLALIPYNNIVMIERVEEDDDDGTLGEKNTRKE